MNPDENAANSWEKIDSQNFRLFVVGVVAATLINQSVFSASVASSIVTAACLIGVYAYLSIRYGNSND